MAQSIFYSILFFDSDNEHSVSLKHCHIDSDIMFCNTEQHLIQTLSLYDQVKVAVCVCCKNKRHILDNLQESSNVASILVCTKHHSDCNEQNYSLENYHTSIKQNSLEDTRRWQVEAHTDALNANNQEHIITYIRHILQQLLNQEIFEPQNSIEEETSSNP